MKKLSLYVFLLLVWCNVGNALDNKDKLTFDRCNGEEYKGLSWEINFEKSTLTVFEEATKIVVFQERYLKKSINVDEPFIYIQECCDRTQYIFNMKTGKITRIAGWTDEKTFIMCKIATEKP
jgi:hypothetical protein